MQIDPPADEGRVLTEISSAYQRGDGYDDLVVAELARQGVRTIPCNIGNPQALGQHPLSYYRQVLSLVENAATIGRERRLNVVRRERPELAMLLAEEPIHDHVLDIAEEIHDTGSINTGREAFLAIISLSLTLLGADLLVRGARAVAETVGISDAVISLTLVAIGTSLPELATAVAAARRNENDLVLGNVLGSNIFNALGVGGVAGIVGNASTEASFQRPLIVMLAVMVLTGVLALTTKSLGRREGAILLITYPLILFSI